MIITLPLIASLLFILSQGTEFEHKIDQTRCGVDTACFVRQSCIVENKNDAPSKTVLADYVPVLNDPTKLISDDCDVIVQMKAFSDKKYLVLMQVKPDDTSPTFDADKGISIMQAGVEQIACKKGTDPSGNNQVFTLTKEGLKSNELSNSAMFCSFFITSNAAIASHMDDDAHDSDKPTLVYHTTEPKILTYEDTRNLFWMQAPQPKCALHKVEPHTNDDDYLLNDVDLAKVDSEIKCDGGNLLVNFDAKPTVVDKVVCSASKKWEWIDGTSKSAPRNKPIKVGCVKQKYCEMCADTIEDACTTPDCTKPTLELTPEGCKTFKCAENSFAIKSDKNNLKGDGNAKCQKNAAGVAAWHITEQGKTPREVTDLSCRSTISCDLTALNKQCPADRKEDDCQEPTVSADDVTCPDGLKLHNGDTVIQFSCDKTKGTHNAETGPIYCAKEKSNDSSGKKEEPSTGGSGLIIGVVVVVGFIIALVAIGGVLYVKVYKKRKAASVSKGAPASSTKASQKKSSESHNKSAEVRKDKKESSSDNNKESEKPAGAATGDTPKEQAKTGDTPKDKVETPGATPAATAPTTPATPATPAAPAAAPKSNPDDQTGNAPV